MTEGTRTSDELPAGPLLGPELVRIVQSAGNYKATATQFQTFIQGPFAASGNGNGVDLVYGSGRVVNSIAALRALLISGVGRAFVLGYTTIGDGGGGAYYYDSTDTTSTDNGGTIIVASDGGRWKLVYGASVTTAQFGATGVASDDTTSHQNAINWCISKGVPLQVSPVTSLVSALTINGPITIYGAGAGSGCIVRQIGNNVTNLGNVYSITGTTGGRVEFRGFKIDGQNTLAPANSTNDLINCQDTGVANGTPFYLVVHDMDLVNPPYRSIAFYGANDTTKRELLIATENRFRNGATNAVSGTYSCIDIHLVNLVEYIITGNEFAFDTAPTLPGGRCAVVVAQTQTVTPYFSKGIIAHNRINYRGINVTASLGAIDLYIWTANTVVTGNIITNSTVAAIKWKANSYDVAVFNNKIDGTYTTGGTIANTSALTFAASNFGTSNNQHTVQSNQITNWTAGGSSGVISVQPNDAGSTYSQNVAILDNQIYGCSGLVGIDLSGAQNPTVSRNEIVAAGNISIGIRSLQGDGVIKLIDNRVSGTTSFNYYVDTPATATQDVQAVDNTAVGNTGTYSMYLRGRQVLAQGNFMSGGVHGINFGGGVQSALIDDNTLANMSGTVGFNVSSTSVNVVATNNRIIDSASITTNALLLSSSPTTLLVNRNNTWNGIPKTVSGSTYTVVTSDSILNFATSATCTVTLPSAAVNVAQILTLRNTAAFAINSASSNVVPLAGGAAGTAILAATAGKYCTLQSDGTNWIIQSAN